MNGPNGRRELAFWVLAVVLGVYLTGAAFYLGGTLQTPETSGFAKWVGLLWVIGGCLLGGSSAATIFPAIRAATERPYTVPRHQLWAMLFGTSVGLLLGSVIPLGNRDVQTAVSYGLIGLVGLAVTPWLP